MAVRFLKDASIEQHRLAARVAELARQKQQRGLGVNACCLRTENLTREHSAEQRSGNVVWLCRRCGRRHVSMPAEPFAFGLRSP